jgi:hypothetical protein
MAKLPPESSIYGRSPPSSPLHSGGPQPPESFWHPCCSPLAPSQLIGRYANVIDMNGPPPSGTATHTGASTGPRLQHVHASPAVHTISPPPFLLLASPEHGWAFFHPAAPVALRVPCVARRVWCGCLEPSLLALFIKQHRVIGWGPLCLWIPHPLSSSLPCALFCIDLLPSSRFTQNPPPSPQCSWPCMSYGPSFFNRCTFCVLW